MRGEGLGLDEVLRAAEDAAPGESVDVVARNLEKRFGASDVSFLFVDVIGQEAVRLPRAGHGGGVARRGAADRAAREPVRQGAPQPAAARGGRGRRRVPVVAPVTHGGDCVGVLEMVVPHADDTVRGSVAQAAHALAYIVVTDRRFTDPYHWARRTMTDPDRAGRDACSR